MGKVIQVVREKTRLPPCLSPLLSGFGKSQAKVVLIGRYTNAHVQDASDGESLIKWWNILHKKLLFKHWQRLPALLSNLKYTTVQKFGVTQTISCLP